MISMVAWRPAQHSAMLGQPASSHTVWSPCWRRMARVSANCGEDDGTLTRIQSGFFSTGVSGLCAFSGWRGRVSRMVTMLSWLPADRRSAVSGHPARWPPDRQKSSRHPPRLRTVVTGRRPDAARPEAVVEADNQALRVYVHIAGLGWRKGDRRRLDVGPEMDVIVLDADESVLRQRVVDAGA